MKVVSIIMFMVPDKNEKVSLDNSAYKMPNKQMASTNENSQRNILISRCKRTYEVKMNECCDVFQKHRGWL